MRRLFEGIGCGKVVLSVFPPSLTSLSFIAPSGTLTNNYKAICDKEQQANHQNPGHKSAFAALAAEIRENCLRFNNQVSAVKVHIPKPKGAAKGKSRKGKDADLTSPKEEEE